MQKKLELNRSKLMGYKVLNVAMNGHEQSSDSKQLLGAKIIIGVFPIEPPRSQQLLGAKIGVIGSVLPPRPEQ